MYVPNSDGNTPVVLIKSEEITNPDPLVNKYVYKSGMILKGTDEDIEGRDSTDPHPAGLSVSAFYDVDALPAPPYFPSASILDAYYTESTFGDPSNLYVTKTMLDYPELSEDISYTRSSLDGISIDFNPRNYQPIVSTPGLSTFSDYNSSNDSTDFEFNCILVYYDVYNQSTPTQKSTNLYGVIFMDNITPELGATGYIERFKKYKYNPTTKLNGNAFGLTLGIKVDTTTAATSVSTLINDYNSYSLDLYSDALIEMKKLSGYANSALSTISQFENRVSSLENLLYNTQSIKVLEDRLNALQSNFENANLMVSNSQILFDFIDLLNSKINDLVSGKLPVELQYNTDVLQAGDGILLDTNIDNKIIIKNTNRGFNKVYIDSLKLGLGDVNTIQKDKYNNYFRYEASENSVVQGTVIIRIDDSSYEWNTGDVFRFSFTDPLELSFFEMSFYTDAKNTQNAGEYGIYIGSVGYETFSNANGKPVFEIVCLDKASMKFTIDILR